MYDDNFDSEMNLDLDVAGYESRMEDDEWTEVVSEIFFMMSNDTRANAVAAALNSAITENEWYFEQAIHDAIYLWNESNKAFEADVDQDV